MRRLLAGVVLLSCCGVVLGQVAAAPANDAGGGAGKEAHAAGRDVGAGAVSLGGADSDHDGLSDALENELLQRFAPEVMVGGSDCSVLPAEFLPNTATPYVLADNGTVYGQASPVAQVAATAEASAVTQASTAPEMGAMKGLKTGEQKVELHYYLLWRSDCGRMGHALDAEHVSVLVEGDTENAESWRALYWYAAAHEDTVCDASQMTRASTIDAERHGARVWLSNGKHGSFLNKELCNRGCGGDRCVGMKRMAMLPVVNVGEPRAPMNGALWVGSSRWPLLEKMERSDFTASRVTRLEGLPVTDVAWAEPAKRPAQAAIRGGNAGIDGALVGGSSTADALGRSNRNTNTALVLANNRTTEALDTAAQNTGHAISKSAIGVRGALGNAWKHTGGAMGTAKESKAEERSPE